MFILNLYDNYIPFLDFYIWKEKVEKDTDSSFVRATGEKGNVDKTTPITTAIEVDILHQVASKKDI